MVQNGSMDQWFFNDQWKTNKKICLRLLLINNPHIAGIYNIINKIFASEKKINEKNQPL
jgi:hypothetical protein